MIEHNSYDAFAVYPAGAGTVSPIRQIGVTMGSVKVTLQGTAFTVRIQVSNAQAKHTPEHLFTPSESDWETHKTVTTSDPPTLIPAPVRWVRLIVDSGQVGGGNVAESSARVADISDKLVADIAQNQQTILQAAAETLLHAGVDERFITYDGSDPPRPTSEQWTADGRPEWYTGAKLVNGAWQKIRYHASVAWAQWEPVGEPVVTQKGIRARAATNLADYLPGRTATAAIQAALDAMHAAGGSRLDLPPGDFTITAPIIVRGFDLHLRGAGGSDFTLANGSQGGTILRSAPDLINMFLIQGRDYQEPGQAANPNVRVGSLSVDGIVFQAAPGVGVSNSALRFEVKNGPMRPIRLSSVTMRGYANAVDVAVLDNGNTGIGPITIENSTFGGGVNFLRSRGYNGVLQLVLDNIVAEQGARLDLAYSDTDRTQPGAMGLIELRGGLYEGQSDAIKVIGGNVQIRIVGPYMERNTGRSLDLKATNVNASCHIEQINTEHDPLNAYVEGFDRVSVNTNPRKIKLRIARNGPRSRYQGVETYPLLDAQGSMMTARDPADAGSRTDRSDLDSGVVAAVIRVPNQVGVVDTPAGRRAYHNLIGAAQGQPTPAPQLRVLPFAVTPGQVVVVQSYIRCASGNPLLGYGLYDEAAGGLDSKTDLVRLDNGWSLVTLAHKVAAAHPYLQFAWIPGGYLASDPQTGLEVQQGIFLATDAFAFVLANEDQPLPPLIPAIERASGTAIISAGATDTTVMHGLPFAPTRVHVSYPGSFGGTGNTQDRFYITIPTASGSATYINWIADPY